MGGKASKRILNILRLCIIAAPFIWIFGRLDFDSFAASMRQVQWWALPLFSVCILSAMFLQGLRWWVLMRAFLPGLSFSKAISAHFKGLFYSIVLPSSAAQDVVRAALLSNRNDYPVVWASTWLCRLAGLVVLALYSLIGLFLISPAGLPSWLIAAIIAIFAPVFLLSILSFSKSITRHLRPVFIRFVPARISHVMLEIRQAIFMFRDKKACLAAALFVSLLVQMLNVVSASILVKGVSGAAHFVACLFFIPAIEIIVTSLPLTPNGMGVREALQSLFLNSFLSFSAEQIGAYIALAIFGVILRVVGVIPIIIDFIKRKKSPRIRE